MSKKKYKDEVLKSISIVCEKAPDVELDYFCKIWKEFWIGVPQSKIPYIAVTDMGVPELYIRASGAKPLFLFGGSYFVDEYTEEIFPQVSDPVVKSTSSMLFTRNIPYIQNIMAVVVPVRSASARKILPYLCARVIR